MATRGLVLYLLSGFSVAVLSTIIFVDKNAGDPSNNILLSSPHMSTTEKVWPKLELSWRLALATVIGFLGSACGTVGGVGGGGIFVPMLTLIVGFDTKSAAAISKCMIMGASASSVWYNLRVPHPTKEVPIIDYDLALLFQPMLMLGITIGVALSVVFPYWLITVLIIILFLGTSTRSVFKGIEMWKEETILKKEMAKQQETVVNSRGERKILRQIIHLIFVNNFFYVLGFVVIFLGYAVLVDTEYEPLVPKEEKSEFQTMCFNLKWKRLLVLVLVWASFLLLQVFKNDVAVCSTWYWVLFCLQFPIALAVFGHESVKLYKEHKERVSTGNTMSICEASIAWTPMHIAFCALCGIIGGTVGGLLGSGGGFILGPLLLEIGVIPQVASATATFVMLFSSSLSVVEFYLLKRFPIPYALYLMAVSVLAGFWGQFFIRKLITILRRASLIVFILSGVIFASALTMGVIGIESSIEMIKNHEFMGFLGFCSSQ
ncbi:sulfite exporter TauE/SafE family protein 4 isoform X1 [Manihot esculenta]|uniref:sulfite exporter TauE/SafE family protein 4 isoform X1 n=1 Tax=Manihot esculenta TaxID=3983 RepID=UPI001CC72FEB|nr:sulfite exporter TauE/SafE family protein 4 isoform X1 [Manihot esculenta]